ncbi:MAG: GNAT family N-acetyltransferase [Acidimicrobiales bacterium]
MAQQSRGWLLGNSQRSQLHPDVDTVVRSATAGITIGEKDLRGQGYGLEALGLLIGHLFGRLNLRRIQLDTWSGNERAIGAFRRLGFQVEARLRDAVRGPDRYYDSVIVTAPRRLARAGRPGEQTRRPGSGLPLTPTFLLK